MGAMQRNLRLSRGQADYLHELIRDDLEHTELSRQETEQAKGVVGRLYDLLEKWDGDCP